MGIMTPIARAILQEHKRRPFTGDGLLIGRQSIPLSVDDARRLILSEGIALRDVEPALDTTTRASQGQQHISDIGFFSLFCDLRLRTLDVTDYEGAEIVHDMHQPIPDDLANSFDFIWNGSCLDNMFDPAQAMRNTGRMLRHGGRVICMEMATPHFNAYTMYSHCWFFDYFAINKFAHCYAYSCVFDPADLWDGPFYLFRPSNFDTASYQFPTEQFPGKAVITLSIAEAGDKFTWDKMPIQGQYRPDQSAYREAFYRFLSACPLSLPKITTHIPLGFAYVGALTSLEPRAEAQQTPHTGEFVRVPRPPVQSARPTPVTPLSQLQPARRTLIERATAAARDPSGAAIAVLRLFR